MRLPHPPFRWWLLLLVSLVTQALWAQLIQPDRVTPDRVTPDRVLIVRDTFGVAHIFAPTDAEVAYGLAWANAEDGFATMQQLYLIAKGRAGLQQGIGGALYDFTRLAFHVPQLVLERYEKDLSPEFRRYVDGYVQGLNAYAASYPKEVLDKNLFPMTGADVLQGYVMATLQEQGLIGQVGRVFGTGFDTVRQQPANLPGRGSNGLALARKWSEDGQTTRLLINPHRHGFCL